MLNKHTINYHQSLIINALTNIFKEFTPTITSVKIVIYRKKAANKINTKKESNTFSTH